MTHDPLCRHTVDSFTGNERCDCVLIKKVRSDEVAQFVELVKAAKSKRKNTLWDRFRRRW